VVSRQKSALPAWRILIVDDEANLALTLQAGLRKLLGCEVVAATCGEAALQLIRQQPFDLLITDYWMPDMNGITLAERAHEVCPGLPSMMITAYHNAELHEQAMAASVNCILAKPIELTELRSAIEALAENGARSAGVPIATSKTERL
jgi:CheY-like chemotaxis protein